MGLSRVASPFYLFDFRDILCSELRDEPTGVYHSVAYMQYWIDIPRNNLPNSAETRVSGERVQRRKGHALDRGLWAATEASIGLDSTWRLVESRACGPVA